MTRLLAIVAGAMTLTAPATSAAPITGGVTDVTVIADLAALGLGAAPLGTATADGATFSFPITGDFTREEDGSVAISHSGSGLTLSALADQSVSITLENFFIDRAFADGIGAAPGGTGRIDQIFDTGVLSLDDDTLELFVTGEFADPLTDTFGVPDLSGAVFGTAVSTLELGETPDPSVVLLPASLPLSLLGLGGLAAFGRRRA